jgi:hypothetical protein
VVISGIKKEPMIKQILKLIAILLLPFIAEAQDFTNIKNAKPFTINGSLGASSVFYNADGIDNRQSPFSYGFNANLNMSVYGVLSLPFSVVWYNQQSDFNYPSFNRFGMSPKYKWITAHFGHRSMRLSEYTLNGHTFLGAGVELTPGKLRLAAMYGKFNQNSEYDPYMADSLPRFTRLGWAAKVGYGTEKNFVDVSLLRIGDDTKNYAPSSNPYAPTPAQNIVAGLTTQISVTSKLSFSFDGAISCFTKNVKDSTIVKLTGFGTDLVKKMIDINMTSVYYTAFKTALAYKITDRIGTSVEYRHIDPEYQSLGAYFCNNDLELITINANAGLLKNKLQLRGSLGMQHDNLGKTKKFTSNRVVGSLAGTVNFNQNWGLDANYSNFSTNQRSGRTAIIDSLRLFQVNHNFSLMPRYSKVTTSKSHFVMLSVSRMQLDDKNKKTAAQTETNTTILATNYSLGLLKSRTNITFGLNLTSLENNMYDGKMYGGSIGATQALLKDKLSMNWSNTFMANKIGGNDGKTFNTYLSVSFRPHPKHAFNLGVNYISNSNSYSNTGTNTNNLSSYNETRGEIRYAYTF